MHEGGSFDRPEHDFYQATTKVKKYGNKSFCEENREASLVDNPEQAPEILLGKIVTPYFKYVFFIL